MLQQIFFQQKLQNYLLALMFLALTVVLGYHIERSNFIFLMASYVVFFLLYLLLLGKQLTSDTIYFFVATAILLRFTLLFSFPNLSDDVYRFIWDGRLLVNGLNPFDHLPAYYIENKIPIAGITEDLFLQLNSPEYFTIYPPVAQLNFALANGLFPNNISGATFMMKVQLFLFEIGAIYLLVRLLKHFKLPLKNVLIYALNPLIILEIVGNLHFEGAMVFFLLLSIWLLIGHKYLLSAGAFALSIASKLLPLMFLPFLIKRLGWGSSIRYFLLVGIALLALFIPLFSGVFLDNFGESLNLYFQKFEFNASVYYVLRWVGYQYRGYNIIQELGPALAVGTLIGILLMAILEKKEGQSLVGSLKHLPSLTHAWQAFFTKMLFAITLYLAFTTIVHPWYTALPVALCVFTNYRYPIIWSGLVFLTYINYSYNPYYENLWMVTVEYFSVGTYLLYEFLTNRSSFADYYPPPTHNF